MQNIYIKVNKSINFMYVSVTQLIKKFPSFYGIGK